MTTTEKNETVCPRNLWEISPFRNPAVKALECGMSSVVNISTSAQVSRFARWAIATPALTQAIAEQSATLMHCSNLYYIKQQADLAELIVEKVVGHPGKIFFSNSGAEAVDGLIKFARRFGQATGRYDVITFNKSFHGRTIGAMTATAQAKIHEGFDPLPTGFTYVEPQRP